MASGVLGKRDECSMSSKFCAGSVADTVESHSVETKTSVVFSRKVRKLSSRQHRSGSSEDVVRVARVNDAGVDALELPESELFWQETNSVAVPSYFQFSSTLYTRTKFDSKTELKHGGVSIIAAYQCAKGIDLVLKITKLNLSSLSEVTSRSGKQEMKNITKEMILQKHLRDSKCDLKTLSLASSFAELNGVVYLCSVYRRFMCDLFELLQRTSFDSRRGLTLISSAAESVEKLHSLGIVHSDIKPENFLMSSMKGKVVAEIADFDTLITSDLRFGAAVRGTPGYCSPERFHGDNRLASIKDDCWAFGCVVERVYRGFDKSLMKRSREVIEEIIRDLKDPRPLCRISMHEVVERVQKELKLGFKTFSTN